MPFFWSLKELQADREGLPAGLSSVASQKSRQDDVCRDFFESTDSLGKNGCSFASELTRWLRWHLSKFIKSAIIYDFIA